MIDRMRISAMSGSISCWAARQNCDYHDGMEFDLDIPFIRALMRQERELMRDEIRELGVMRAFDHSQARHDARIAASSDVRSLACRAGCVWCCYFTVDVRAVEVFRIVDFIDRSFTAEAKARVFAEVRANSAVLAKLGEGERVTRNIKCPLLHEGRCTVYEARPQSCRNYHATSEVGCRQSYEQPENLDIDPEFAPGVYQAGSAH